MVAGIILKKRKRDEKAPDVSVKRGENTQHAWSKKHDVEQKAVAKAKVTSKSKSNDEGEA